MNKGLVLLPTVLILGFVVVSIGLTGLFMVFTLNRSNYGIRLSTNALAAAQGGINDANLRIIRGTSGISADCSNIDPSVSSSYTYSLAVGDNNAYICVQKTSNTYNVYALGVARNRWRQLKATFDADPVTNQIRPQSINEIQL